MKIKNKILMILAIIVASLFICSTKSNAEFVLDGVTFPDIPVDEYSDYIVDKSLGSGSYYVLRYTHGDTYVCYMRDALYFTNGAGSKVNWYNCGSKYKYVDGEWVSINVSGESYYYVGSSGHTVLYTNQDLYSDYYAGNVSIPANTEPLVPETPAIVKPAFVTTVEELQTGKIGNLIIKANDFNNYEKITLSIAEVTRPITSDSQVIYHNNMKSYDLYSTATFNDFTHFVIESSKLNYSFENDKEYVIYMTTGTTFSDTYGYLEPNDEILDVLYFTVIGMTSEEILQDKQDVTNNLLEEQQEILKEQTETSKGIWGTIKEILSYLNPFSENFFAYKLVELILDGLKSLFIPSDDFFETFFTEMKDWFSERLGFLFYPFELVIDILNKILNVNFSEPVFNIPDINEPFTGQKLIGATTYNLNSLLSNAALENIHNIYLVIVDSIIIFALVNLAKRKFEEVTSK